MDFSSPDARRDPYPMYETFRSKSPALHIPQKDAWMLFDYEGVKRALTDHDSFSSRVPAPEWFMFFDPPRHTRLRSLISRAFTSGMVANLEPRIRDLSRSRLNNVIESGEMDLAVDYSVPIPLIIIAEMIGIPAEERDQFKRWSDVILNLSRDLSGGDEGARAIQEFHTATAEMSEYLRTLLDERRTAPRDDLLTRLMEAEVDGERLSHEEILSFFQLLLVGGQETTTNLINNAILCFIENPIQFARLKANPALLSSAIEEVLRYRSPFQWTLRATKQEVSISGQTIPAGKLVLPIMGSANRDFRAFRNADRFDITRTPNAHLAFGHGIHFCLGAPLARLEARIALSDLLDRVKDPELASNDPWEPRLGLHVHGPERLPIRFRPGPQILAS